MGELKNLSTEETSLVARVRDWAQQVYLAHLGLVARVEEESRKQYDKALAAGKEAHGEGSDIVLAVRGLVDTLVQEAAQLKLEDVRAQALQLRDKLAADDLRQQAQKLFSDLVIAGEKRKAA